MGKKTEFLYLNEQDVIDAGVLDQSRCVEIMDEAFKLLGQGDYVMGGKLGNEHGQMIAFPDEPKFDGMPANGPDRRFMAMLAYLGGRFNVCGEKWYGSNIINPKRGLPRSILLITLNDPDTCEPIALMSGNLISAMRTGCVPGVGVKYLARKGAKKCAVIGAGPIGKACLKGIKAAAPDLTDIIIYDWSVEVAEKFAAFAGAELGLATQIAQSAEEAIREGDIVSFACSSINPTTVKDEWLKAGSLCICTGGYQFEADAVLNNKLVFDNPTMHQIWCDEEPMCQLPDASVWFGLSRSGKIPPISEHTALGKIACGEAEGRRSEGEKIILATGGMPIEDVAWAYEIYQTAQKKGLGQMLKLWDEPHWS